MSELTVVRRRIIRLTLQIWRLQLCAWLHLPDPLARVVMGRACWWEVQMARGGAGEE